MEKADVASTAVRWSTRTTCVVAAPWALVVWAAVSTTAQTNPRTLPAVTAAPVYLGSFTIPPELHYGGHALGLSADGASLYYTCIYGTSIARLSIPALGGTAAILEPCGGPDIVKGMGQSGLIGGILHYGGAMYLTTYGDYDAGHSMRTSHWSGAALNAMSGPDAISNDINPGLVAGYMAVVPAEWRALLGGPVLSGQCCISIISRSSHGPAAAVFDPADRKKKAKLLQGYPYRPAARIWGIPPGQPGRGLHRVGGLCGWRHSFGHIVAAVRVARRTRDDRLLWRRHLGPVQAPQADGEIPGCRLVLRPDQ